METRVNPIWCSKEYNNVFEYDKPPEEEDPTYPTIILTGKKRECCASLGRMR